MPIPPQAVAALIGVGATGLAGLSSFGLNQASSAINSSRAWKYAQRALALQDQYNRNYYEWSAKNGYSFNREGLVNAGYNPLLALGSGANSASSAIYSPSMMNADSDAGDQAINSAMTALTTRSELKTQKLQQKNIKLQNKHQELENERIELENQKLENEINSSPRTIISELIHNDESKTVNSAIARLAALKNAYGLQAFQPRNFIRTNISRAKDLVKNLRSNHSASSSVNNGKLFQLGIKYFDEPNNNETIGVWNSNRRVKGQILSDSEAKRYINRKSSRTYSRPPKSFPR